MHFENFDKTGYQLRLIPQQRFYSVSKIRIRALL